MATMDVFKADAFSMISLTQAIENIDYKPQFIGSLGLFDPEPSRTRAIAIESRDEGQNLIPISQVGAPLEEMGALKRKVRNFQTYRIAKGSTIYAEELQGIRAFGSETELEQVQAEVAKRMARLMNDVELTWEHMRLGAIQGLFIDSDGSTVVDYFSEFGVSAPAEVPFDFGGLAAGEIRELIERDIVRPMVRASKGAFVQGSRIIGLVGDLFWDELMKHEEVRNTYLNYSAASALRGATGVFGSTFPFAGIDWINYRGTDDESTVAIAADKARFFPAAAPGIFQVAWGPGEFMDTVNQPGRDVTALTLTDQSGRNAWARVELYSYPLYICTRPGVLFSARVSGT